MTLLEATEAACRKLRLRIEKSKNSLIIFTYLFNNYYDYKGEPNNLLFL